MKGQRIGKKIIKKLKPIVKTSAKILLILFLLYKFGIISKTKIMKLINEIKEVGIKKEDGIFEKLEKLDLPISIQRRKKDKRVIKIPELIKTLIEIGIKVGKNKNGKINDQNDEQLIRDILKELEKLGKK